MPKAARKIILFAVIFIVLLAGYFALRLRAASRVTVPQAFSEARGRGAVVSQDIVNISNGIAEDVKKMQDLDRDKKYEEALGVAASIDGKLDDLRTKAIDLTEELEAMTAALAAITDPPTRQAALDSISSRMALISRLVTYTDGVKRLTEVLRTHFETGKALPAEDTSRLVAEINAEVRAINAFNGQASQAMDRFDEAVR